MRLCVAILGCALVIPAFATEEGKVSLGEVADHAVQQSKLTLPGSRPFHLKAKIIETTNPSSEYQAKIEEHWVSPEKWRRTIEAPEFSQTLIINGDKVSEKDTGSYFPWWLNDLVTAIVDPLPMLDRLKQLNAQVAKPRGSGNLNTCADLRANFDQWGVFCFEGSHGLLTSVITRGYSAQFADFKSFGDKRVARRIVIDPEPGTTIQASIIELEELSQPDEEMFVIQQPTPREERIRSVKVDRETLQRLSLSSMDIDWPLMGGGLATGGCAVYVSADRAGHMREVWPQGCDNPGLQDPLREMVKKWQLKPATADGAPVQVEALVTFVFHTKVVPNPLPELSNAEARRLATRVVEPVFPPGSAERGTEFVVQISVDETGALTGVQNTHNLKGLVFLAASQALSHWHFQPYIRDGKPQYFNADIIFRMK